MSGYPTGGYVKRSSGPDDDTIPVMLGRHEHWLTAEQVRKLTEETRGGEEPLSWKVSPGAIAEAEDRDGDK